MTRQEMNELYGLIKEAVKDGFKEAMMEMEMESRGSQYPDSERPFKVGGVTEPRLREAPTPTRGETGNSKGYLDTIRHKLDTRTFYGRYTVEEELERMRKLLSEDEISYVLTHLRTNYVPENKKYFDENVEELLKRI